MRRRPQRKAPLWGLLSEAKPRGNARLFFCAFFRYAGQSDAAKPPHRKAPPLGLRVPGGDLSRRSLEKQRPKRQRRMRVPGGDLAKRSTDRSGESDRRVRPPKMYNFQCFSISTRYVFSIRRSMIGAYRRKIFLRFWADTQVRPFAGEAGFLKLTTLPPWRES